MQTGLFGMPSIPRPETEHVSHGDRRHGLTTLHTPGHTPGSCCFHGDFEQGKLVLAGDTLFQGGVGRTDLWGGDWAQLEDSIRRHLYTLEPGTLVIPGHGPSTTIGAEAEENPFVSR
jgi:hydroxyacylglutathione hydrolase